MDFLNFEDDVHVGTNVNIENTIFIYDDFLTDNDFKTMTRLLRDKMRCSINNGHTSVGYHPYTHAHYSFNLTDIPFFNTFMLNRIEEVTGKKFEILRIYSSLQKHFEYGNFHIDDSCDNTYTFTTYYSFSNNIDQDIDQPVKTSYNDFNYCRDKLNFKNSPFNIKKYKTICETENNDTICDLLNEYNINGNFEILLPSTKNNIFRSIPFVSNRGCFFRACLIHNGASFNTNINMTRCVISFKLKEIK
tara:strand:+ start:5114 stop:5854 length:741 start_codon:yes stop_codon:yes gene_type:complete